MVEASFATITNITLDQTVDINGNLEPCHFLEFDSDLQYKIIPGDDVGIPSARIKFLQGANYFSRASVPPINALGFGKPPEIIQINRTNSAVNGVPAWGIAIAKWTNSPSPAPAIGDEVEFAANTNTIPLQTQLITGCIAAEIQSTLVTWEDFAEGYAYDVWFNTRDTNSKVINTIRAADNDFTGLNSFDFLNIPTYEGNPNGVYDGSGDGLTAGGLIKDTTNGLIWSYSGAGTVWYNAFGSIDQTAPLPTNHHDVKIEYTSANTITVKSGSRVRSDDNTKDLVLTADIIVDITASGIGGLDTGSEAASTFYYLEIAGWLNATGLPTANKECDMADGTRITAYLTASNRAGGGSPTIPTNYTKKRQTRFAIRNDGSLNIIPFSYVDNKWVLISDYSGSINLLTNGAATSYTPINCSSFVPPISTFIKLLNQSWTQNFTASRTCYLKPGGFTNDLLSWNVRSSDNGTSNGFSTMEIKMKTSTSQIIEYRNNSGDAFQTINFLGFLVTGVN